MASDILVSPLGRAPGAVSGVYFALRCRFEIGKVVTVGTSHLDVVSAADNYLGKLLPHLGVMYERIHVPAKELRGGSKAVAPYVAMIGLALQQAHEEAQQMGGQVHVAVTGGRSGMGALAALATNLYGADHLWHLWVHQDIEKGGTVDQLTGLTDPDEMRRSPFLNPTVEPGMCEAVELPLLDLRPLHDVLWDYRRAGKVPEPGLQLAVIFSQAGIESFNAVFPPGITFETADEILQLEALYAVTDQTGGRVLERRAPRQEDLTELRQVLARCFSEEELRTLCFDLSVDYDDLPAEGRASKARELLLFLVRRDRIPELVEAVKQLRPDIRWEKGLGENGGGAAPERAWTVRREQARIMNELAALLERAGVVNADERDQVIDLARGKAAPQALVDLASQAQSRAGFWPWLAENKDMVTTATTTGAFLLKALELWLKVQGYI